MDETFYICPYCDYEGAFEDFCLETKNTWRCPDCDQELKEDEIEFSHFLNVNVTVSLKIPYSFEGFGPWPRAAVLDSAVSHWLEEGYYAHDHIVELPNGIVYKGYSIEYPDEWLKDKREVEQ